MTSPHNKGSPQFNIATLLNLSDDKMQCSSMVHNGSDSVTGHNDDHSAMVHNSDHSATGRNGDHSAMVHSVNHSDSAGHTQWDSVGQNSVEHRSAVDDSRR